MDVYWKLFVAFVKSGTLTFGGGPSAIPLIQQEVVEHYMWFNVEEFTDALALGNSLPGPIATKMAALIGFKVAGWSGAIVSILATIVPSSLAIIFLINLYQNFKNTTWMKGMMLAVRPVVVILIAQVVYSMSLKSFPDIRTVVIGCISAVALFRFDLHPVILIISSLAIGGIFFK